MVLIKEKTISENVGQSFIGQRMHEAYADITVPSFIKICKQVRDAKTPCFRSIAITDKNYGSGSSVAFDTYSVVAVSNNAVQFRGLLKNYLEIPIRNIVKIESFDDALDITTKGGIVFSLVFASRAGRIYFV